MSNRVRAVEAYVKALRTGEAAAETATYTQPVAAGMGGAVRSMLAAPRAPR